MSEINILIVEDDPNLGDILREYLELKGYPTTLAIDGEQGFKTFQSGKFNFCILDVMMPKKDGFTLAKEIRAQNADVPIIFLTAKSMKQDTLEGFRSGGDDYLTKPFSMEELLLRIKAIWRRTGETTDKAQPAPQYFTFGKCTLDADRLILLTPQREIKLTAKENDLLQVLCNQINQTIGRSEALKKVWGDDSYFNARSMDVYIAKLRKYLKDDDSVQILTIHGTGFKLVSLA